MASITSKSLAEQLCRKFPDAPTKTLARRLYAENKERFGDLECARSAVRLVRGAHGKKNEKQATARREKQLAGWKPKCPPSIAEPWRPFDLGGDITVASLSDLHVPYHDRKALLAAVRYVKRNHRPDVLLINGDGGDFFTISRYERNPKERNLSREITLLRQCLEWLRAEFPKSRFVYKMGNHDVRWDHFIWNKAPELWDLSEVQLHHILHFAEMGIERVDDQMILAGDLPIIHGHELPRGMASPVNHARGAFLRALHSLLVAHGHRTSTHCEPNIFGKETTTWSQGCLSDLTPPYNRVSKYNHGFAVIKVAEDKTYDVFNYRIGAGYAVRQS